MSILPGICDPSNETLKAFTVLSSFITLAFPQGIEVLSFSTPPGCDEPTSLSDFVNFPDFSGHRLYLLLALDRSHSKWHNLSFYDKSRRIAQTFEPSLSSQSLQGHPALAGDFPRYCRVSSAPYYWSINTKLTYGSTVISRIYFGTESLL